MPDFKARFYNVSKCGYYEFPAESERVLGGLDYLMRELAHWSNGKNLVDTRLPTPSSDFPTYLAGIAHRAGCWVFVLWNEVPAGQGGVASVMGTSPVGQPEVHENRVVAGTIPGFPTYFLVIPGHSLFATLRLDTVTGLEGCKNYLKTFQEISTRVAVPEVDDAGIAYVAGYENEEGEVLALYPRFQLQLIRSGTRRAAILAKSSKIRKIVRVKEMDPTDREDRALYQRGLDWIGLTHRPPADKVKFRQEVEVRPTREEAAGIIDAIIDEVEPRVNDVGFVFVGEQSPLWLSGSIPADTLSVDVDEEEGVYSATALVATLSRRRDQIIAASQE